MTAPKPQPAPASASGVRRMGDEHQDLAAWAAAVCLVHPGSKYAKLQMEMNQQGNLDDVVLRTADVDVAGDLFQQLKWTTSESNFLDDDHMTTMPRGSARSLLKKLHDAYNIVNNAAGKAPFQMQLHSSRPADPTHPLLSKIDGRTGLLVPFAANASVGSNAGKSLAEWAAHLDVDREDVRGHFRQATAFLAGASFPKTRGFELECLQGPARWTTDVSRESADLDEQELDIGQVRDLAFLIVPAARAAGDVARYIRETLLPVGQLIALTPAAGEHDGAIRGAGHAVGIAGEVRQRVRNVLSQGPPNTRLHLFLAEPNGLALFLGHRWNAIATTITYEHRGIVAGYAATFTVDA